MVKLSSALSIAVLLLAAAAAAPVIVRTLGSVVIIDGHDETIALATAQQMGNKTIILSFVDLILSIIKAFNTDDFDYWDNVEDEVEALVGDYINEHNMHQVEVYQDDLEELLLRYLAAPVQSTTYPDKNHQAAALSMSIISHRYLVMSGDLRFSLILDFEDIASMHIVVLKDAADTYSVEGSPSQWWVDLDEELEEYITYSTTVSKELQDFRIGKITCEEKINTCTGGVCYDIYRVTDAVTGEVSDCKQVHGASDCTQHCQIYKDHVQQELDEFLATKVTPVADVWRTLQQEADNMTVAASEYYDPVNFM